MVFAKSAQGFTLLMPSIMTAITIVLCMFHTVACNESYSRWYYLCFICWIMYYSKPFLVGVFKFDQMPNLYTIIGLALIIIGVLMVNLIGKTN